MTRVFVPKDASALAVGANNVAARIAVSAVRHFREDFVPRALAAAE
jgi:hypothetical protein